VNMIGSLTASDTGSLSAHGLNKHSGKAPRGFYLAGDLGSNCFLNTKLSGARFHRTPTQIRTSRNQESTAVRARSWLTRIKLLGWSSYTLAP